MAKIAKLDTGQEIHFPDDTPDDVMDAGVQLYKRSQKTVDSKHILGGMQALIESHKLHNDAAIYHAQTHASVPQDISNAVQTLVEMCQDIKNSNQVLIEVAKNIELGFSNLSGTIVDAFIHYMEMTIKGKEITTDENGNPTGIKPIK